MPLAISINKAKFNKHVPEGLDVKTPTVIAARGRGRGVVRPSRAAPRLAGRGDPSPRGCPPYAPRAGVRNVISLGSQEEFARRALVAGCP
eukprot:scaffold20900_cov64-Phaeocystis_antarctica.AAC.2